MSGGRHPGVPRWQRLGLTVAEVVAGIAEGRLQTWRPVCGPYVAALRIRTPGGWGRIYVTTLTVQAQSRGYIRLRGRSRWDVTDSGRALLCLANGRADQQHTSVP